MDENKLVFLNRDMSWLSFNQRVLKEAADDSVPLYSRLSFLSIFSSNLDEFFRVRMPAIFAFTRIKAKKTGLRDEYPKDLVQLVQETVLAHQEEFGRILSRQILPDLRRNNIYLYYRDAIRAEHRDEIRDYFLSKVLSFLQPLLLTRANQSNVFLENNALYFLVEIEAEEDPGVHQYALLNIPSNNLPRFLQLSKIGDDSYIIFLDDIIRENLAEVFPGFRVHGAYSIKLTRDAEMALEDEFIGDIAEKIEKQLEKRDVGHSTRFLHDLDMPEEATTFIREYLGLRDEEMVDGGRYHNLRDLGGLPNPQKGKHVHESWDPISHPGFSNNSSIFQSISEKERLLHLPYHNYNYILRFFNEAAIDPKVKEIYVTLYRVASNSHIVNALISAARNGKKVIVFVELKARFDEANNLRWSKKMKTAGIKIIYSIPGIKVHAKVALVKRYDGKEWTKFSFMATGNFNEATGRFYTDHVFFTTHAEIGLELDLLFDYLQSRKPPSEYMKLPFKHLLVSQFNLMKRFNELIDREIQHAKEGRPARIIIKLNNLQEKQMITRLYKASRAGVQVDMLVRSVCCLAPGISKLSENIRVIRIVDRYLEHARVFVFHNNGNPECYMGSADWMNRNLHSRIEVVFPVYDRQLARELEDILQLQLNDTRKACLVDAQLNNLPLTASPGEASFAAQEAIYRYVKNLG